MKWTIERFETPRMLRVKLRGIYDTDNSSEVMNLVSADMAESPGCPILFDYSDLDIRKVGAVDLAGSINTFVRHNPRFDDCRVALYSGARADLELAYQFKTVTESLSNVVIEVFQRESEAVRWLTSSSDDDAEVTTA